MLQSRCNREPNSGMIVGRIPIPGDGPLETFAKGDARLVSQLRSREGKIGEGVFDVAGPRRLPPHFTLIPGQDPEHGQNLI